MYIKKNRINQRQIQFLCLEDLVPADHLVRDIDRALDFSFIYEEVKGLYSDLDWGKPGIDPVSIESPGYWRWRQTKTVAGMIFSQKWHGMGRRAGRV